MKHYFSLVAKHPPLSSEDRTEAVGAKISPDSSCPRGVNVCGEAHVSGVRCTRHRGHDGVHVAHNAGTGKSVGILAVWRVHVRKCPVCGR